MKKPKAQQRLLRHLFSRKGEEGFTLVELIVVIIIMAILSQIGMVSFNRYIRRTRAFAAETAIRNIKRECETNRDLGMDPTFTPLTPIGYSIQPDNSNSCLGESGSGMVYATPENQGEYPAYNYDFITGSINCSYSSTTDNLFPECTNNVSQSQSSFASGITDWKAYAAETAENFEKIVPEVKSTSCETSWAGTSYTGKAEHAVDGDASTSWTCDGMGEIEFDLGKKQEIRSINVEMGGHVANGNYVKIYVDKNLVHEGSVHSAVSGKTIFIEPTVGRIIRYEAIAKPHTLNHIAIDSGFHERYGDTQAQTQLATWTSIEELSVNGPHKSQTNKGYQRNGTGIFCGQSRYGPSCE